MEKGTRYLLAAFQAILGYEWLISGANKLISGRFPQGLADTLHEGMGDNPNVWYSGFLHAVVIPQSIFFGYLIEFAELAMGIALLAGALALIGRLPARGERGFALAAGEIAAAAVAALGCAFLCVNFHFFMGNGMLSALNPSAPFDEGIDLDTLLVPLALVIAFANGRLLLLGMLGPETLAGWQALAARFAPRLEHATAGHAQ